MSCVVRGGKPQFKPHRRCMPCYFTAKCFYLGFFVMYPPFDYHSLTYAGGYPSSAVLRLH